MKLRAVLLWLAFAAPPLARAAVPAPASPLLLISLDGFRWDYCDLFAAETPTLRTLKREGVSARGLIPVFPSNTFPNHYSIATGLYPARHGMVNNDFFDPALGEFFHFNVAQMVRDPRWWGGEPIWVTAIKQGRKAAVSFWVGSEAEVAGVRPTFWRPFENNLPFERRLEEFTSWLALPAAERPAVIACYLDGTNNAGHRFGPTSPQVVAAARVADQQIAALLAQMRTADLEPNIIVVSDHGMTATSADRAVIVDEIIDLQTVQIDAEGSTLALRPREGDAKKLVRAFDRIAHVKAYLAEDLPAHFHYRDNPRIAPVWVLPENGWHVVTRALFQKYQARYAENGYLAGDHGYDPMLPAMRGVFIAQGPAFRRGVQLDEVENIHIYNLICAALKLTPAKNDGDARLVKAALRE